MLIPPVQTICITLPDLPRRATARYGLEEAFVRLGLPRRIVEGEPTAGMIVYGPKPDSWQGVTLCFDRRCYEPDACFVAVGSPPLWAPEGVAAENVDLIGGLSRLLTLADETGIPRKSRNSNGIFLTTALPESRARVKQEPMVEHHVMALAKQLQELSPGLPGPTPLWPAGRRYAVVVTHDTDAVALDAPMEIVFNAAKAAIQHDPIRARMAWDGLIKRHNPLAGFDAWASAERSAGIRGAFFIFGRHIVPPHLNDCRSSLLSSNVDWKLLQNMADEGWEFGYHAPIRAKEDIREFIWAIDALQTRLGHPIHGVRHHYWALDWLHPHLTFRKHRDAGFHYDSSIAWRDSAGFRAGTCLPYRPFDPDLGHAIEFYELPTAIMDGHVIKGGGDVEVAVDNALRVIKKVRAVHGMVVLDWHTETAIDRYCYRHQSTVLLNIIATLRADSEAWFVTPWELIQHWRERSRALCFAEATAWH